MTPTPLDIAVASTVAKVIRNVVPSRHRSASGLEFERVIYEAVSDVYPWHHAASPDQFDMNLPIASRTGVRYEFDGVFASPDTLYVVEAKHLSREQLAREHVGIFVQKLLDTLLGSYEEIGHYAIKPIIASAHPNVDAAARRHAAAWGILLLAPDDVTPLEILCALSFRHLDKVATDYLAADCAAAAAHLWRPFNDIVRPADADGGVFSLHADRIRDARQVARLMEHCDECRLIAEGLGVLAPRATPDTARIAR